MWFFVELKLLIFNAGKDSIAILNFKYKVNINPVHYFFAVSFGRGMREYFCLA